MAKDNCFPSSPVLENAFHPQSEWREQDFILYTKKNISLWTGYCTIRNVSSNPLNFKLFLTTETD